MAAGFFASLLDRAGCEPDRRAMVVYRQGEARDVTQGALVAGARRWAGLLRERGARPGCVVLLSLPLCVELVEAFLGALWAGAVPSFMPYPSVKQDPRLFWSSHDQLFARLGGGLIVTTPENERAIEANITQVAMVVVTPREAAAYPADGRPAHSWANDDIACLQHSSGTTGLKKGVMLSFAAIEAQVAAYRRALGIEAGDTIVSWLPLYHDMGFVACLLLPLALGTTTVLLDPFEWLADPLSLLDAVARHEGGFVWLPNFAFAHLVNAAYDDERRVDLSGLRAVIDCSEPCRAETLAAFERRFAGWGLRPGRISTCYAMAETVFAVTQSPLGQPPRVVHLDREALEAGRVSVVERGGASAVSSGVPLDGVAVTILDEDLATAASGRVGQIAVRAPFLFAGYHLEPERTAAIFHDGFFLTNDLGFRIGDDVFVLGRRDDLLILLGRNVFAHQIEQLLDAVPGLKPGRILAMALDNAAVGSQDLVILVELTGEDHDLPAIRGEVRQRLESILGVTPKKVVFVEQGWLVKSTSGKISRAENRRRYVAQVQAAREIPAVMPA